MTGRIEEVRMAETGALGRWCVYMLLCRDGSLYTGVTTDLKRRLRAHETGRGAKYTRGRGPFELYGFKGGLTRGEALRLERRIKSLSAGEKRNLVLPAAGVISLAGFPT
jgi:putative endonuclease